MDDVPPPPPPFASAPTRASEILVCQAGSCRNAGSEAVLLEIEELAKSIGHCIVEDTGCLGQCSQAPAVLIVRGRKELVCTRITDLERSAAVVQQATGKRPAIDDPALVERLSGARQMRIRNRAREESKWNAALCGMAERVSRSRGDDRLQLQLELSRLLASAGLWEQALMRINEVQSWVPHDLSVLMERVRILGKLGRKEDIEEVQQQVSAMRLDMRAAIELSSLFGRCKGDPHGKLSRAERPIENYAAWSLQSVTKISRHTAIYHLTCRDRMRGTPNPRGRGRTVWPKTWHTTMLAQVGSNGEGPLPYVERDYTPISSAKDWEQGKVDVLVKVYATGLATQWLLRQPIGSAVLLSQPAKTLDVPSLVPDLTQATFKPASMLLLLAGSGIVVAPQVLHHASRETCFGPMPAVTQPISLMYSCRSDDVCMLDQLTSWCSDGSLQRCTLLLTEPQGGSEPPFPDAATPDVPDATALPKNMTLVRGRLTLDAVADEVRSVKDPCRVVVSGPEAFNSAVKTLLRQAALPGDHVTILSA